MSTVTMLTSSAISTDMPVFPPTIPTMLVSHWGSMFVKEEDLHYNECWLKVGLHNHLPSSSASRSAAWTQFLSCLRQTHGYLWHYTEAPTENHPQYDLATTNNKFKTSVSPSIDRLSSTSTSKLKVVFLRNTPVIHSGQRQIYLTSALGWKLRWVRLSFHAYIFAC